MKTSILDILIAARKKLIELSETNEYNFGLCNVVRYLYREPCNPFPEEEKKFYKYYIRTKRGQKWFYDSNDFKVTEKGQFGWKMGDHQSRLKWLNVNIKRLQDER